jgi:hypothetical protein
MSAFAISPLLREVVELKATELDEAKQTFKRRFDKASRLSAEPDSVKRVASLLADIKSLEPDLDDKLNNDFEIASRYLGQADSSPALSEVKVLQFEKELWARLKAHSNRLGVSSLHNELLKEAMTVNAAGHRLTESPRSVDSEDDFEVVDSEVDELWSAFEKDTFTATTIDGDAIDTFLSTSLDAMGEKLDLEDIRDEMDTFGEKVLTAGIEVDQDTLMWCIVDLLKTGLISPDKKKTLESYMQSPIAIRELVSMLNGKSIRHWKYKHAEKGLPVTARQGTDGEYHIVVEEEIIDLLFMHCLGMGWATELKSCLVEYVVGGNFFAKQSLPVEEAGKREYFLGYTPPPLPPMPEPPSHSAACAKCHHLYEQPPPPPTVPPPPFDICTLPPPPPEPYHDLPRSHRKFKPPKRGLEPMFQKHMRMPPPPRPMYSAHSTVDGARHRSYSSDFFLSGLPSEEGCTPRSRPWEETQAKMIKTLAVEAKLGKAFGKHIEVSAMSFNKLVSALPHKTILVVLRD